MGDLKKTKRSLSVKNKAAERKKRKKRADRSEKELSATMAQRLSPLREPGNFLLLQGTQLPASSAPSARSRTHVPQT